MKKEFIKKNYPLFIGFFVPVTIMLGYFIYRGMYPFGKSSLLTVDLGQQYVDFFAAYRDTLLHDPTKIFYSFSKAIGGWYDIVVAMYHDQGHIPLKVKGFVFNREKKQWDAVAGINVTLGIPIIRVSVDHGTGYDMAGNGLSNELSLVNSIEAAVQMANYKNA